MSIVKNVRFCIISLCCSLLSICTASVLIMCSWTSKCCSSSKLCLRQKMHFLHFVFVVVLFVSEACRSWFFFLSNYQAVWEWDSATGCVLIARHGLILQHHGGHFLYFFILKLQGKTSTSVKHHFCVCFWRLCERSLEAQRELSNSSLRTQTCFTCFCSISFPKSKHNPYIKFFVQQLFIPLLRISKLFRKLGSVEPKVLF